jgi:hypothetical protein
MMMNSTMDIEDLLKRLPTEKTGDDFTAQLMSTITALPIPCSKQLGKFAIICICIGALGLTGAAWWVTDYFFDWTQVFVQPLLSSIAETFGAVFSKVPHIEYSPIVIEGLLAGAVLLLIDAAVRRRLVKN